MKNQLVKAGTEWKLERKVRKKELLFCPGCFWKTEMTLVVFVIKLLMCAVERTIIILKKEKKKNTFPVWHFSHEMYQRHICSYLRFLVLIMTQ